MSSGESVDDLVRIPCRHVHLPGNPKIGAMRNAGCRLTGGNIIAHFDDDDYSGPDRLRVQVDALLASGKAVAGFRSMRFTDGKQWWEYTGRAQYALGTSLVYLRSWWAQHPFPEVQVAEDFGFTEEARRAQQLHVDAAGDLMWATIHPENTSPRQTKGKNWRLIA